MATGRCHKAHARVIPDKVVWRFWPPDSPERNPLERLWPEVQDRFAGVGTAAIEEVAQRGAPIITQDSNTAMRSLTSYPYFGHAVHAVCS